MQKTQRIFTIGQVYHITLKAFENIGDLKKARNSGLMSKAMQNHIMLSVTEVNGCALCEYAHTKDALEMGMSEEDIERLMSGSFDHLEKEEAIALTFAQHYADTKGDYSKEAWDHVVNTYGHKKALGILATIRVIMFGNVYGISLGALWSRIKGNPMKSNTIWHELSICLSVFLFVPIALIRSIFILGS